MNSRKEAPLSEHLTKRWLGYAAAAGAAGLGLFSASPAAKADIIYTYVDSPITGVLDLDFTPGTVDFQFMNDIGWTRWGGGGFLTVHGMGLWSRVNGYPLRSGIIGSTTLWFRNGAFLETCGAYNPRDTQIIRWCAGPWVDQKDAYLGLEFQIGDSVHYGWARLNVGWGGPAELISYAYNAVPNQPIGVGEGDQNLPEPGTLGLLALGSLGLSFRRRRKMAAREE